MDRRRAKSSVTFRIDVLSVRNWVYPYKALPALKATPWLERLGNPRKDAAARQLVSALPAQPVIDVAVARAAHR
jgi:hypothetical protein